MYAIQILWALKSFYSHKPSLGEYPNSTIYGSYFLFCCHLAEEFTSNANNSTTSTLRVFSGYFLAWFFFWKLVFFFITLVQLQFPQDVVLYLQVRTHSHSNAATSCLLCLKQQFGLFFRRRGEGMRCGIAPSHLHLSKIMSLNRK